MRGEERNGVHFSAFAVCFFVVLQYSFVCNFTFLCQFFAKTSGEIDEMS